MAEFDCTWQVNVGERIDPERAHTWTNGAPILQRRTADAVMLSLPSLAVKKSDIRSLGHVVLGRSTAGIAAGRRDMYEQT